MFEKIYEEAQKAAASNKKNELEKIERDKKYKEENSPEQILKDKEGKEWATIKGAPLSFEVVSKELFKIINNLGFEIIEYNKRVDEINYYEEYDPVVEFYTVKNNKYQFIVKNMHDVDIEDGIFGVHEITNLETNKNTKYYVDLSCRNTGKARLDDFLLLISCDTEDEFLNRKYRICMELPEKLEKIGCKVVENTFKYSTTEIKGYLMLDNGIYIVPYRAWCSELRFTVTNYPKWDVNDSNGHGRIGYYINYKEGDDVSIFKEAILALKLHLEGKYGFLENNHYYQNSDVEKFFNTFKDKKNGQYRHAYNYHFIRIEQVREWDGRGYGNLPYISVLSGLELACHYNFEINTNPNDYGADNIINDSDIVIKYNRKENPDSCVLIINDYQYTPEDDVMNYEYDEDGDCITQEYMDRPNENYNKEFLIDSVIFEGTFSKCMQVLNEYIYTLLKIFDIDIEKRD